MRRPRPALVRVGEARLLEQIASLTAQLASREAENRRLREALTEYVRLLRQPSDRSAFGLETTWLTYGHCRAEVADEIARALAADPASPLSAPDTLREENASLRTEIACREQSRLAAIRELSTQEWIESAADPASAPAHPFPNCDKGCGVREGVLTFCRRHQPRPASAPTGEQP